MTTANEQKKRYQFYSRRGMKEVEVVLLDYLERYYDDDDDDTQLMFGRLLKCDDVDMFDWFIRNGTPDNEELARYVKQLTERVAAG